MHWLGERAAVILALAVVALLTPLRALWVGGPWWSGFVLWGFLVAGGAWLAYQHYQDEP